MARFNHAFDIGFALESEAEDASDVTPTMLRAALLQRIVDLDTSRPDASEWIEATGKPFDTYALEGD